MAKNPFWGQILVNSHFSQNKARFDLHEIFINFDFGPKLINHDFGKKNQSILILVKNERISVSVKFRSVWIFDET